jgi:hypothetical protein
MHDICRRELPSPRTAARLAQIEGERPETIESWKSLFETAGLVDVRAFDKSQLLTRWVGKIRSGLGLWGEVKTAYRILRRPGIRGLIGILESEVILRSRYMGYGMIVGRKPDPA